MNDLIKLYIEPTSDCNLNCEMCFRHSWFDEKINEMPFTLFEKIIREIPNSVNIIFFAGMGEPLYHPKIIDMVSVVKEKGLRAELLTNGSLLTEEMSESLLDIGLDRLWVSIDVVDPSSDEGLGHPMYTRTIKQLKKFNSIRSKKRVDTELGITFVATKENVAQLAVLPLFISKFNISEVNISNLAPTNISDQEITLYQKSVNMSIGSDFYIEKRPVVNLPYMDFNLPEVKEGLSGLMSRMNFNLQVGGIPVPRKSRYCPFVKGGMAFVRSDGEVTPCMALLHNGKTAFNKTDRVIHHHSFGNVASNTIADIWMSPEYIEFKRKVIDFEFSPCITCGQCDYSESNQEDCFGNVGPTCGACLWAEGFLSCP